MANMPKEKTEILKNEEELQMKYEENNKITRKFMEEINEMKSKMVDYNKQNTQDIKHKSKPIRSSEFNTFMKIIDNGDTIEEYKTVSSKETTIKNYVLQKEIDRLNSDLLKKEDMNDHLQDENKKLTEEKDKYIYQLSLLKEKIRKHDREVEMLTGTLKTRDSELNRLIKDMGGIEKKFKHEQIVFEKQRSIFIKTADENKQLKETLKKLETVHKETEDKYVKMLTKNDDALAKCNREKEVLISGFRKQLELIDSLKRQNVKIKLQEEINILENEFSKLLEGK
ncbi:uncharacterized protein PFB0145c-like [Sipha flava]|jgi:chromosome segregation ATPase|uniref:Uncharacterized protein PFB0145c-like n=1 Tax=Sipha flava TaxID=143950 RepID=A0A8B8GJR6_9HEMI|nr:uncharacterized protein PFB0145c-like [Sipha flava]